jgi:DNA-binding XRE family transcriptional regulator
MPDKRRKSLLTDAERDAQRAAARALRETLNQAIAQQTWSVGQAVKQMRRLSGLTQAEFATHRGISLGTLKQIESGAGQPRIDTLNKIGAIFGLEVGFIRKLPKPGDT